MPRKPADPVTPKTTVEVASKKYHLTFSFNALAVAEELTGLNLLTSLSLDKLSAQMFRALLFAALVEYQPEITLEKAGDLITPATATLLSEALGHAFAASNPDAETQSPNV